jgi:hypothetical protein
MSEECVETGITGSTKVGTVERDVCTHTFKPKR